MTFLDLFVKEVNDLNSRMRPLAAYVLILKMLNAVGDRILLVSFWLKSMSWLLKLVQFLKLVQPPTVEPADFKLLHFSAII